MESLLHYNRSNSFFDVNRVNMCQFKAKNSNMKKAGLKGSIQFFSVNYNAIDTSNILDINRYLMK